MICHARHAPTVRPTGRRFRSAFVLVAVVAAGAPGEVIAEPPVVVDWSAIGGPPSGTVSAVGPGGTLYLSTGVEPAPARPPRSRLHVDAPPGAARPSQATARSQAVTRSAPAAVTPPTVARPEPEESETPRVVADRTAPETAAVEAEAPPSETPPAPSEPPAVPSEPLPASPATAPPPPPELPSPPTPPPPAADAAPATVARAAPDDGPDSVAETAAPPGGAATIAPGAMVALPFDAETATLAPAARNDLDAVVGTLSADEDLRVQILAFAGGPELNASRARRLSLSRALAVREYLKGSGIDPRRIDVRALGDKATGEPRNRVDVKVVER